MPEADDGRGRAYRKRARDGTPSPVLLWWVGGSDRHPVLDAHARPAAAIAESVTPPVPYPPRTAPADEMAARTTPAVRRYEAEPVRFAGPLLARQLREPVVAQRPA
ncbi:hypothetical protein QFZ75_000171 [Streptomyces sp. V3I8]|uniref:hypothetical protein n=1 Tax=Streptomyces sp. V3I8 TaxID=3042279 RepID=UPI00277E98F9|nr:hypothetical protein [Streptomyces sp. V3I8]MDQ1033755.1 hypothetical protein [Streptomyces sp. V3I8]